MAPKDSAYKRPGLWRHPRLMRRRVLASWPFLVWLLAIGVVLYMYQGNMSLRGMAGIVDTTAQPVAPLDTARLAKIHVVLGQRVKAGDVVATMDTSLVDAELAQLDAEMFEAESSIGNFERTTLSTIKNFEDAINSARAEIEDHKRRMERDSAQLQQLETEQARLDRLFAKQLIDATQANAMRPEIAALRHEVSAYPALIVVAEKRLEDALRGQEDLQASLRLDQGEDIKTALGRRAEAQRMIFEASHRLAAIQLQNYTLTATHDATVSRIFHQPGVVVSAGDPILRLVNARPTQIIGFLPEAHLSSLKEGQRVRVTRLSGVTRPFTAIVLSIAPELDTMPDMASPIRGQPLRGRRVIARLEGEHDLIPGETVRIDSVNPGFFKTLLRELPFRGEAAAHE